MKDSDAPAARPGRRCFAHTVTDEFTLAIPWNYRAALILVNTSLT
jgi:hypothetical protein